MCQANKEGEAYTIHMATRLQKDLLTFLPLIVSALLVFSSYLFYSHEKGLHQKGYFHTRQNGAYIMEVKDIRGFMTFDYINTSFHLPNEYLKNALSIVDTSYPHITVKKAGILSNKSEKDIVSLVQEKVTSYTPSPVLR